jgi:type VI secretion system protein ImpH
MAGADRDQAGTLTPLDELRQAPERFTLFGALRLIEQTHPERPRLGESRKASDDRVRIAQEPHLYFAPTEVLAFGANDGDVPELEQLGFGVFGPNGALPLHLTELAYSRKRQLDDPALADFINTFQHRFASLFYRAWANTDPCTSLDRPGADQFRLYLGALIGIGAAGARERDAVLDYAKLSRVGLFAPHTRSGFALEKILAEYFELAVEVIPFIGTWLDIAPDAWCRLARTPEYALLGVGATLGTSTWQCQSRFEIALGPLRIGDFVNFLPGSRGLEQLKAIVRLFTNEQWYWHVRLLLEPADLPPIRLGQSGWLGWTTWLGPRDQVARDATIEGSRPVAPM